jgi:hypothetical protein
LLLIKKAFRRQRSKPINHVEDACIAAHYVARYQANPEDTLRWHQEALHRAQAVGDERVHSFYPSLYVNMRHAHEPLGNQAEARRYYALAAELGVLHQAA